MQTIYLKPQRIKTASLNVILAYKDENEKYEYQYDVKHEKKPSGGGWEKTDSGWTKGVEPKENENNGKDEQKNVVDKKQPDAEKQKRDEENKKLEEKWIQDGYKKESLDLTAEDIDGLDLNFQFGDGDKKKFSDFNDDEKKQILEQISKGETFHNINTVPSNRKLGNDEISDSVNIDFGDGKKMTYGEVKKDKDLYEQVKKQIDDGKIEHTGFAPVAPKPPQKDRTHHKLNKINFTPNTNVELEDGTKKKFKDLDEKEQKVLFDAMENGQLSHKGMNDYNKVDIETFKYNKGNTLGKLADDSVSEKDIPIKEKITKDNVKKVRTEMRDSLMSTVDKYHRTLSTTTKTFMETHVSDWCNTIEEAVSDGSIGDIDSGDLHSFIKEDIERMVFQEEETKNRSLGGHGIGHLANNAHNSVNILTELKRGGVNVTGKDKLMALAIMANHDNGYVMADAATTIKGTGNHKKYSGVIANGERDRYEKIFGKDGSDKICGSEGKKGFIENHDESDYDWENNPLQSSIALSDITAGFGKEKLQDLFLRSAKATKICGAMRMIEQDWIPSVDRKKFKSDEEFDKAVTEDAKSGNAEKRKRMKSKFEKLRASLHNNVDVEDFEESDKVHLHRQVDEMSTGDFSTAQDILSRYSGRTDNFKYDKRSKMMKVNFEMSTEGHFIDSLFGEKDSQRQFRKFEKDVQADTQDDNDNRTTFSKGGRKILQFNFIEKQRGTPINKDSAGVLKDLEKNTARDEIMSVNRMLSNPATKKVNIKKAEKILSGARDLFDEIEWKKIMDILAKNHDNPKQAMAMLNGFGLTKKEESYLSSLMNMPDIDKDVAKPTKIKAPEKKIQDKKLTKVEDKSSRQRQHPTRPLIEKKKQTPKKENVKKVEAPKKKVEKSKSIPVKKNTKSPAKKVEAPKNNKSVKKRKLLKKKSSIDRWIVAVKEPRRMPNMLPPRDDLRVRYKKEDVPIEERGDYEDVHEDSDLADDKDMKTARRGAICRIKI